MNDHTHSIEPFQCDGGCCHVRHVRRRGEASRLDLQYSPGLGLYAALEVAYTYYGGSASALLTATLDDLVAFHDQYFHPNNTILRVWGDFEIDDMVEKLGNAFSVWLEKEGFRRPPEPPVDTQSEYGVYYAPKMDVTQSTVVMVHPGEIRMITRTTLPLP